MTVTSRLQTERQRKTKENVDGRPVGARRSGFMRRGSNTWAPSSGPRIAFSKNLRGQGSGLSTCQAEGGPHAPEESAPPPTVGFRVIIDDLVQIPEETLSLVIGKEIQQAKKIPMNAPGRGDNRREESATHILCRVAGPIFVNLLLCPVGEQKIDVRMTLGAILRRVSSAAMKVMNPGSIDA